MEILHQKAFRIRLYNYFILIISLLILGSCNSNNPTIKHLDKENIKDLTPNLERESPVVWQAQDSLYCPMHWIGNYRIQIDTVITFDPVTFDETVFIYNQTIREGTWYLKDCENIIYSESTYENDSLISQKKIKLYKEIYDDMKSIGNFEEPQLVRKEIDYY